jgi:hypothetical protein
MDKRSMPLGFPFAALRSTLPRVAQPARRSARETPPLDPSAVQRAYRHERAKRRARHERDRAHRRAGLRFLGVLLVLLGMAVALGLTAWQQIERLFGL